jgi:hypothetical protein
MNRSLHATVPHVALGPILILVLLSLLVTSARAAERDEFVSVGTLVDGQSLPASRLVDASRYRKFAVEVRPLDHTMETAEFVLTLPEPGRGSVTGLIDDGAFVAFSRSFVGGSTSSADVPVTLSPRALAKIRQRGFLSVTLRTEFTPIGSTTPQKYKSEIELRPFSVAAASTDGYGQTATATFHTPRHGRLAVKFHLRDRATKRSLRLKSFGAHEVAGGIHTYSAQLTEAARRAIIIGKALLMVTAKLDTDNFSARMTRSTQIRCRYCGAR